MIKNCNPICVLFKPLELNFLSLDAAGNACIKLKILHSQSMDRIG
jgi:hypothetical protein